MNTSDIGDLKQDNRISLAGPVVRSAGWVLAGRIGGALFDLAKALVLARLLNPQDFGLFAIVMLTITIVEVFSQSGFNTA